VAGLIEISLFRFSVPDEFAPVEYSKIHAGVAVDKAERIGAGQNSRVSVGRPLFVAEFHTSGLTLQEPL
jgi:hypothetical protein